MKNLYILILLSLAYLTRAQDHPCLILTGESVPEMREAIGRYPLWKQNIETLKYEVDIAMQEQVDVPVPVDPAGGYTHSQHKQNAKLLSKLGTVYQIYEDEKYANHAKKIFLAYADLYPMLDKHPVEKSYARGKLFWQQLNEAVWLVDAIQGYDGIYHYLTEAERKTIEKNLLYPIANFLSVENANVFNRIHNHGVWAVAATGMTGIVLDDNELICRALYGINKRGKPNFNKVDKTKLEKFDSGFFVQTSSLFSPDGYYTEGPYYQRYAMTPFLLFAQSIHNNIPKLEVLEYGNQIFIKAVETLIELADANGKFFPINDNLKGMSLNAPELVWGIDFLYANTKKPDLLSIAKTHSFRSANESGLEVAKGLSNNIQRPIKRTSKFITDGSNGLSGGIAVLHDSENKLCTVFKFASQGLTHGHYDRLNIFHYYKGDEVLTDYGAARFVNIKAKQGGRYLPENETYVKQTVAHNTLVVDEKSHFDFKYKEAEKHHPKLLFSDINNPDIQLACAYEVNAYPGIKMTRVVGQVTDKDFINPVVIDLFNVKSNRASAQYDLPFHFAGQLIEAEFEYKANQDALHPMSEKNGYQHLWLTAKGKSTDTTSGITWLKNNYIYSLSTTVDKDTELILAQIGANDPNFNLKNDPVFIIRQQNAQNHTFASILECHGYQNPDTEIVSNQTKQIKSIKLHKVPEPYLAFSFITTSNIEFTLLVSLEETEKESSHSLEIEGKIFQWSGAYKFIKN